MAARRSSSSPPEAAEKKPRPEPVVVPCRAESPDHVWTYDFIEDALLSGRKIRLLNILDEFTREWVAVRVGTSQTGKAVVAVLLPLFRERGVPQFLRSDNGGEFIATEVKEALKAAGASPMYIKPGSPWENGFVESFPREARFTMESCGMSVWMGRRSFP